MLADGISTVNSYLLRRYASVLLVLIIINDYPIFVEIAIFCHKRTVIMIELPTFPFYPKRLINGKTSRFPYIFIMIPIS